MRRVVNRPVRSHERQAFLGSAGRESEQCTLQRQEDRKQRRARLVRPGVGFTEEQLRRVDLVALTGHMGESQERICRARMAREVELLSQRKRSAAVLLCGHEPPRPCLEEGQGAQGVDVPARPAIGHRLERGPCPRVLTLVHERNPSGELGERDDRFPVRREAQHVGDLGLAEFGDSPQGAISGCDHAGRGRPRQHGPRADEIGDDPVGRRRGSFAVELAQDVAGRHRLTRHGPRRGIEEHDRRTSGPHLGRHGLDPPGDCGRPPLRVHGATVNECGVEHPFPRPPRDQVVDRRLDIVPGEVPVGGACEQLPLEVRVLRSEMVAEERLEQLLVPEPAASVVEADDEHRTAVEALECRLSVTIARHEIAQ